MMRTNATAASGLLVVLTLLMQPAFSIDDEFWPGWLGPDRNGWVPDFEPPTEWPPELRKNWQVSVGTGYGSPLVADNRVYVHAREGESEVISCRDLGSGEVIWRQSISVPFKMGGGGEWHGKGPKSCPVLADGRLFAMSITGDLSAWDAETGEALWRSQDLSRFKGERPYWGAATSPIVDGKRVIVHFGNDDSGALVALDAASGQEIWSQGDEGASYSSPLIAEIEGVRQVVEWNHEVVAGVDTETGDRLWEFAFPHEATNQNMPTPAVHNGRVLVGGENRGIHGLEPRLKDGVWTVKKIWSQKDVALDMSSAVVNDGLLFGFSHYNKGQFFCLEPGNGNILWQGPGRTGQNVMFLAVPGHIVALIDDGELLIFKATGEELSQVVSYRVSDSPTWAPPVLLDDGFLIKDQETLARWSFAPTAGDPEADSR